MPSELSRGKLNEEAGTLLTPHRQGLSHKADAGLPAWEWRGENPGAAEVWFEPPLNSCSLQQDGMERMAHCTTLLDSTSYRLTSDKSFPLSGHMPPPLESGAHAYFPGLLGAPDEIIYEHAL